MTKILFPLLVFASLLTACIDYEEVRLVAVNDSQLERMSPEGIVIRVNATVDNPNPYKITLNTDGLDVYLNNKYLGKAKLQRKIQLQAKQVKEYEFFVVSEIPEDGNIDIGTLAQGTLMGSMRLKIEGKVNAKAKGVSKSIDVSLERTISM